MATEGMGYSLCCAGQICSVCLCTLQRNERMATAQTISHWSRPHIKHTDHWSKLKSKSYYHSQTSTGNYICYCRPQNYDPHGHKYSRSPFETLTSLIPQTSSYSHHFQKSKSYRDQPRKSSRKHTLARVGNAGLSRELAEIGSLQLPTAQQWLSGRNSDSLRRSPSASSRRARRSFIYWPREPAKSSSPTAKKVFGTFLGI